MSKKHDVDLLVIGSGPGGYAAAFRAADLGRDVLLVDSVDKFTGVFQPQHPVIDPAQFLEKLKNPLYAKKIGITSYVSLF